MANLEKYFPVVKTSSGFKQKDTKKSASRYTPYGAPTPRDVKRSVASRHPSLGKGNYVYRSFYRRPSDAAFNKFLLSTLKDKNNPITHSASGLSTGGSRRCHFPARR